MRYRSARSASASNVPEPRDGPRVMTAARGPAPATALPRILGPIRPRPRWTEDRLLALAALALLVGSLSLRLARDRESGLAYAGALGIYVDVLCLAYVGHWA